MALPYALGFEVRAIRRADHFTGEQILNGMARGAAKGTAHGDWLAGVLAVDLRDAAAQRGKLYLDILHCSPFLCP
jgi:hypothetical protein